MQGLPSYIIRDARDTDSPKIIELIFNIWVHEYGFNVKPEDYPDFYKIQEYYKQNGGQFLVAIDEDDIVGTLACDFLDEGVYVLKRMFVRKDFRGTGLAQKLLETLFNRVAHGNTCTFYLSTKEDLALAAKKLYLRNGFEVIDSKDLPTNFPFFYEDDLYMKKIL